MFRDLSTFKRAKFCSKTCYLEAHKLKMVTRNCEHCKKEFTIRESSPTRTCSEFCSYEIRKVHGTKYITTQGYVAVKTHGPNATTDGYELEHRLLMEQHLGRRLNTNEHVHHINGNKQDNNLANLIVITNAEHQCLHETHKQLNTAKAICKRIETVWGYNHPKAVKARNKHLHGDCDRIL